ncbi:MAG: arylsulfatase A-like enzyme [Desulforhopalus sp.]|jgi:arylsulfatase A-like enzyme
MKKNFPTSYMLHFAMMFAMSCGVANAQSVQHDAEHDLLLEQHGEKWAAEDKQIDAKLAAIQEKNGGKPPNIVYILVDDVGFGEFGNPILNKIRGYETPNINKLGREGASFSRMYTEPSCTPTRAAFLTGRLPTRSHMLEAKIVPPEASGLHRDEVTIAEVLSEAGYNTVHVGKWHQGDIEESMPHNQGFDRAYFPMHNQATFNFMSWDAEDAGWGFNVAKRDTDPNYRMDDRFRPRDWALGMEAVKGGQAHEWGTTPGDPNNYGYAYYNKLNDRYKKQVVEELNVLAKEDKPFYLNYWPMIPLDFKRNGEYITPNGGVQVEAMRRLDENVGEILADLDRLGIADNTIVALMGDNGAMMQAMPFSGYSDMIFRGGKGATTEGGIRVDAFVRWPEGIEADSVVGDIVHVSDLFTTFARAAQATQNIPTDRIIDGVDQMPLLMGVGNGRRDYIHVYDGPKLAATIKEQYKVQWPSPGAAAWTMKIYDLFRDPRELHPIKTQTMWAVESFIEMRARHEAYKKKFPDRPETTGIPYAGIDNLRPETKAMIEAYYARQKFAE